MSNLTNQLAFAASGLSSNWFAALMALLWLAVVGTEYVIFRWFFADDLSVPAPCEAPVAPPGRSRPRADQPCRASRSP
jgi:arsenical pump membrane protein